MNKNIKRIVSVLTLSSALLLFFTFAQASEPGTAQDPLVSKSYVDAKISEAIGLSGTGSTSSTSSTETVGKHAFEPVNAGVGQIVIGGEGAEIILRSGKGVGYCTGSDGLVNVTTGTELFNGYEVVKNNLIIVPRSDGRGVKVIEDAWFIIKGEYYIMN